MMTESSSLETGQGRPSASPSSGINQAVLGAWRRAMGSRRYTHCRVATAFPPDRTGVNLDEHYQRVAKGPFVPIIKVTGDFCNLRCSYCFYSTLDQSERTVMSLETLERVVAQCMESAGSNRDIAFIWHGGEPLLAGKEFFDKIIEFQARYNSRQRHITNMVQTNGTLINGDWARFFARHHFKVGVSVDGSPRVHNEKRLNAGGKGTFTEVARGIRRLQEASVPVSAIMVLRKGSIRDLDDSFYTMLGLELKSFGFNTYFEANPSRDHSSSAQDFLTPAEYTLCLKKTIDIWLDRNRRDFSVREIEEYFRGMIGFPPGSCTASGTCSQFLTINYDGQVYPCERLPRQPDNLFGDIRQDALPELLSASANRKGFVETVTALPEDCRACNLVTCCWNGCSHHRVEGKYYYCETRKEIYQYLQKRIGRQVDHLRETWQRDHPSGVAPSPKEC